MLKISFLPSLGTGTVLKLEGRIVGEWVAELRRVCQEHRDPASLLTLDLRDVTFIDRAGVAFFDEIYAHVTLVNCSLLAAEQLKPVTERHDAVRR